MKEAKLKLDEANTIRTEADRYKEAVLVRADQQAEEIKQRAETAAEAAGAKLKQQVTFEAQRMLAQAAAMRAGAAEELEAQRIYAEAALLKADAHQTLNQLKAQLPVSEHPQGVGSDAQEGIWEMSSRPNEISQADNSKAHETAALEAPAEAREQVAGTDGVTESAVAVPEGSNPDTGVAELTSPSPEDKAVDGSKNGGPQKGRAKDRRVRAS